MKLVKVDLLKMNREFSINNLVKGFKLLNDKDHKYNVFIDQNYDEDYQGTIVEKQYIDCVKKLSSLNNFIIAIHPSRKNLKIFKGIKILKSNLFDFISSYKNATYFGLNSTVFLYLKSFKRKYKLIKNEMTLSDLENDYIEEIQTFLNDNQ